MNQFLELVKNFNWHNPTWDVFILAAWLLASVFYAFAAGRGRIVNILISVYIAKVVVLEAPFLTQNLAGHLPSALANLQQLAAFVAVFLALFLLLGRYVFKTSVDHRQVVSIIFSLVFAVLQIGLLINIILNYLPAGIQSSFGPLVHMVFLAKSAAFIWLVLPVVYLIILGKFVGDTNDI